MQINIKFANPPQRDFYYSINRNQCFSGGFNNGKTFIGCLKASTLLFTYPNYRYLIARQKYTDLKRTTMQTFFKNCPSEYIAAHNDQDGYTRFLNNSVIFWMHLDNVDINSLRGLEVNGILIDQAEESEEKVYDVLDARLGRWDGVTVPPQLLEAYPEWPMSPTGKPIVPSYLSLLANPDTQYHYIYRKYHPDSLDRLPNHFYVEGAWDANLGSMETYNNAISRDKEWVDKYVLGKWGLSAAQIHYISPDSLLDYSPELIARIKEKGNLFRILDHGDSAPTCCLWAAALDGVFIFYREYYVPGKVISYHRQGIYDLSKDEDYSGNYADPSIFNKASQKEGGFWTIADEYKTGDIDAPQLFWTAADNNEFATRNRINELLLQSSNFRHPITKESPAPGIYFVKSGKDYPYGCRESIRQISMQRRKLLGTLDGKSIYSDERDDSVTDHAYDPVRYFISKHGVQPTVARKRPPRNSFAYYNMLLQIDKNKQSTPGSIQ